MQILIRRFTIIGLAAAVFAISLSMVVERSANHPQRFHIGSVAPCYHPASNCVAFL